MIEINKSDLKQLNSNIEGLTNSLKFQKPIKKSLEILKDEADDNFGQQGRIYGLWSVLAQSTRKQRARLGFGAARPILVRTGTLRKGTRIKNIKDDEGTIANEVDYAKYHQFGTKKIPQRVVLDTSKKSRRAISLVFANFLSDKIKKYFG